MPALRFAVFGKSRLAAARTHAIAGHEDAEIASTWSSEQVATFDETAWQEALDSKAVDAAVFALPPDLAARASLLALRNGIHVLSELPGGESVEDIINLREAERAGSAVLKFGCGLRYHGSVRAAAALVAEACYGELLTARAIYGHAGFPSDEARTQGILQGHGIHMLDLLHLFCGPFESVKAMRSDEAGGEANLFALLKTGTGAIAQLHSSATSWRQTFRIELGFTGGYIWLDGHLPGLEGYGPEMLIHARGEQRSDGSPVANPDETIEEFTSLTTAEDELSEFIDAMAGKARLRHGTSHQAFDAMNIAQRIHAATETWG